MEQFEILVLSEDPGLLRQLLGEARRQADAMKWRVGALPVGAAAAESSNLGEAGADVVLQLAAGQIADLPETVVAALAQAVQQAQPKLVMVGATKPGLEAAPRLAERLGAGYAPWTVSFTVASTSGAVTARCMLFAGAGQATYTFKPGMVVLSAAPNIFEPQTASGRAAKQETLETLTVTPVVKLLERKAKRTGGARLEEAKTVVDVGQGVRANEDLQMIGNLATLLDGQLACSRPVSSDRDWFPEWLGLSGKKVAPELCMTVGVSGAIQHIVGIRDSHLIVAVNSDEGAPIFNQADYGIVADLYEFVPALTERLKARGVRPAWS